MIKKEDLKIALSIQKGMEKAARKYKGDTLTIHIDTMRVIFRVLKDLLDQKDLKEPK